MHSTATTTRDAANGTVATVSDASATAPVDEPDATQAGYGLETVDDADAWISALRREFGSPERLIREISGVHERLTEVGDELGLSLQERTEELAMLISGHPGSEHHRHHDCRDLATRAGIDRSAAGLGVAIILCALIAGAGVLGLLGGLVLANVV